MTIGSQNGLRGSYDNYVPPKRAAPRRPAQACIRFDGRLSWCLREIQPGEVVFEHAEHAVEVYADGEHLRACGECVGAVRMRKGSI